MSDPKAFGIDQYAVWTHNLNGPINPLGSLATSEDESMKIVVIYADHVEALRQAEQRVAEETETAMMNYFYWRPSPPHDRHYFADNICAYCVGQREMLDGCIAVILSMKDSDECEHSYCRTLDAVAKGVRRAIEEKP